MAQVTVQALRELQNSLSKAIDRYAETIEKQHPSELAATQVSNAADKISDAFKVPVLEVCKLGFQVWLTPFPRKLYKI
jgi:hypothetical protein